MVGIDVDGLKTLSPNDRIKKLEEIEEERKQEIERAQELIKESEEELEREEDVKRIMEIVEVPQQEEVNVEQLITEQQSENLEQTVEEAHSVEKFNVAQFYEQNTNLKELAGSIYSKLLDLKDKSFSDTYWTQEEHDQFNTIKNNISDIYINQKYDDAKQLTDMLDASKKILKDLGYNTGVGE